MPENVSALLLFLLYAVGISLSGVMAPGPMAAAAVASGSRRRHAGIAMALGHGVIELPLMLLILAGVGALIQSNAARITIGFAGGAFLVLMGAQMLAAVRKHKDPAAALDRGHPFRDGVVLSGANPYFLLWWATIGLALTMQAVELGILAFVLFVIVHWLCDLVWLEVLSLASFKGSKLFGGRTQRIVLTVCGIALILFAAGFIADATQLTLAAN